MKTMSENLKDWNRQARSRALKGQCVVINCTNKVEKGKAFCEEHK